MPGFNNVCYPDSIVFQNLSTGGKTISWDFDDGTAVVTTGHRPKIGSSINTNKRASIV